MSDAPREHKKPWRPPPPAPGEDPIGREGAPDLPEVPEPPATPHDPIEWDYITSLVRGFIGDVVERYFRAELIGADKIPDEGPCILAPNHSGNAFPHDGVILDAMLWKRDGFSRSRKFRSVFTPKLAAVWWMRPYGLDNWWRRCGGIDMSFKNYDRLLARGDRVIHYPEGVPGIGKGFNRRYQLQHYHSSFVVLAARHDVPFYPVSVVNAEWVNPTSMTFKPIDWLFDKLVGIPFVPLPIAILAFIFPFIFYLAFPCKMIFVINEPVDVRERLRRIGAADPAAPTREEAVRAASEIRDEVQRHLDRAVAEHGKRPYRVRELISKLKEIRGRRLRATPLGWPLAYVRHDRDRKRPPARNKLHAFLRDLDLASFYLPFGWFLLALTRKLRRPPYGYRGLSREERIRETGAYRWDLTDNPLPSRADQFDEEDQAAI